MRTWLKNRKARRQFEKAVAPFVRQGLENARQLTDHLRAAAIKATDRPGETVRFVYGKFEWVMFASPLNDDELRAQIDRITGAQGEDIYEPV